MLHLVWDHRASLGDALDLMGDSDHLLLMGDAVAALITQSFATRLQPLAVGQHLYVAKSDLQARGLDAKFAIPLGDDEIISLIDKMGSPLGW